MKTLPKISDLMIPILSILEKSGPLASQLIESKVVELLNVPNELRNIVRTGKRTELNYRLSWARTKAKNLGYLERLSSGLWQITSSGRDLLKK